MKEIIRKLFSGIFKSKVKIVSVSTFLLAAAGIITQLTGGFFGMIMPKEVIAVLVLLGFVIAEVRNKLYPSGEFIGTGKNWTFQKYISVIGLLVLAILEYTAKTDVVPTAWGAYITLTLIPLVQWVVRTFGGATPAQVEKAEEKGLPVPSKKP